MSTNHSSVKILNENVDQLTKYEDMVKAYEDLTIEEGCTEVQLRPRPKSGFFFKSGPGRIWWPDLGPDLVAGFRAGFKRLSTFKNQRVDAELDELLKSRNELEAKMQSLHPILPGLQAVENDSKQLSDMITFTSSLAENVSSKVRQLDLAKNRVMLCLQRVEDILDLKFCTDGVQTALHDEDYEKAAAHIHRFLTLDEDILRMSADANEGSTLDTSFKLLHEAQTKLKSIVHGKFDSAVRSGDVASVERFFKTFPLIGENEAGLVKFSKYLCSQLSDVTEKKVTQALQTAPSDKRYNVIFSDAATILFEDVARAVEIHQPLVETYYGHGLLLTLVRHLQNECDRQVRRIVCQFKDTRNFDKKIQLIQQQQNAFQKQVNERVEPREADVLLAEVAIFSTRTELYMRFLRRRCFNDLEVAFQDEEVLKNKKAEVDQLLNGCELSTFIQEFIGGYITMEEYFMKQMVAKAISMDQRALSSSNVDCVCAMLNHACALLERDYADVLFSRLRAGYTTGFDSIAQAYNLVQSTLVAGRGINTDAETEKAKALFLAALNNVEVSIENTQTLKSNVQLEINTLYANSCLNDLNQVTNRLKEISTFGFNQLIANSIRQRIKPLIDSFSSVNHNLTEEEFSQYEASDPWVQNLICNIDNLLVTFRTSLTPSNYDQFVSHLSNEVTALLEKVVLKTTFNRLGGLQFDKEIRSLVGYLTSTTTWTIRDKFARLNQMATILNLEKVAEVLDYWGGNSGPLTWRLTPADVRHVLSLRYDFKSDDIKRLKL
ncbi:hypothetical protein HELRODRAFT_191984 [Helobdella robusta]|uniref:Conserved oligomeric Golgi complex subunit 4 n=1 Tax=Helobdella robusta TaxID=6412 RepID=T1FTH6_HELRO|nr:hypothetical protein HELRODRAFT_191984 [Helobdella robusta]ESO03274.1 hypothetical protein HELRODRAFT_191984 [Helobdella robusta]